MTCYEDFIREAAAARGIDPQVAVDVANSEGGVAEAAAHGVFSTGESWWALQLHFGGEEYPEYGVPGESVAGMGNDFARLTAWRPGEPTAWRDAARYGLNRAREGGWSPWYGAASIGVTGFDGIDQSAPWDPNSEAWDYETGTVPPMEDHDMSTPPPPVYDPTFPSFSQNDDWSCAPTSTRWALWAYGRQPSEQWMESEMLKDGIVTQQYGLMDASGAALAAWLNDEYGPAEYGGYYATNDGSVSFDEVAREAAAGRHPVVMGGRAWCHWTGVRGYQNNQLMLANPASGWMGVTQSMSRAQFNSLGPFSMVRLTNPASESTPKPPDPTPADPYAPWRGSIGSGILEMMAADSTTPAQRSSTWLPLGTPPPSDIESCFGRNGTNYVWLLTVNQGLRFKPDG